jgi:hypothetical protein
MRVQKNLAFNRVAISIIAACAIFLISPHGEAQNSNSGKPEAFTIEHTVLFPIDDMTHVPPAFSNGASQFLDGCGSWVATGAIDDQGTATSEETFFFGPVTPTGFGGLVGESDTFESDTNDSFVIDYMVIVLGLSHEGSCVIKGGTGIYSNLRGGNCKVSGTFDIVFPGDPRHDEPDPNCFAGTVCPTFACVFVDQTFTGKIDAD